MTYKKGKYKNILDLLNQNNAYNYFCQKIGRKLEDYLDDYSDREIIDAVLSDYLPTDVNFEVYNKWTRDGLDWRNTKIEIL